MFCFYLDACSEHKCEAFSKCKVVDGQPKCVCPEIKDCPTSGPSVCGSNQKPYPSKCHLLVDACVRKRALYVVGNGTCGEYAVNASIYINQSSKTRIFFV